MTTRDYAPEAISPPIARANSRSCNKRFGGGCIGRQSFGAVLTHLAQGNPSTGRKANPEQAAVFSGASEPDGRMLHEDSCNMRVRQAAARIAVIGLIFMTACASTGPSPAVIDLAVSPEGVVMLDGQPVMMQRLPSALKAEGANRSTGIYVDVPSGASSDMLRGLTETLATAGYTRVIFRTPVKASAVTD